jgi:hypothetical protein
MTSPNRPPVAAPARVRPTVVAPELVPERRGSVSFLSNVTRSGDWELPRLFRAAAFLGNIELDLTRARVGPGTSHIEIASFFGNVTVIVPPELRIECEVDPFGGSCEVKRSTQGTTSPDAPLVRITGTVVLASVEVKVVDPNAPGWVDRLRARWSSPWG